MNPVNILLAFGIILLGTSACLAQQSIWRASPAFSGGLYDIDCLDSSRVIVSIGDLQRGLTAVLGTTDGGRSWDTLVSSSSLGLKRAFNELAFLDSATVLALSSNESMLWRTTDRGRRWDTAVIGETAWMASLSVRSDGYGAVIAYPNTVLTTSDTGRTWTRLPMGDSVRTGYQVSAVVCLDSTTFVCALDNGTSSFTLRTIDGGTTWSTGLFPASHPHIDVMKFTDPLHGWFVGRREDSFTDVLIYTTSDGGLNWTVAYQGVATIGFNDVAFRDENEGIVVGPDYIVRTTNGGRSWTREGIEGLVGQYTVIACAPRLGPEVVYAGNGYRLTRESASAVRESEKQRPSTPMLRILRGAGQHFLAGADLDGHEGRVFDDRGFLVERLPRSADAGLANGVWVTLPAFGSYWLVQAPAGTLVARIVVVP